MDALRRDTLLSLLRRHQAWLRVFHSPPHLVVNPEFVTMPLNFQGIAPHGGQEPKPPSELGDTHGPSRYIDTQKPNRHM
jgi:hypothetical protein